MNKVLRFGEGVSLWNSEVPRELLELSPGVSQQPLVHAFQKQSCSNWNVNLRSSAGAGEYPDACLGEEALGLQEGVPSRMAQAWSVGASFWIPWEGQTTGGITLGEEEEHSVTDRSFPYQCAPQSLQPAFPRCRWLPLERSPQAPGGWRGQSPWHSAPSRWPPAWGHSWSETHTGCLAWSHPWSRQ